MSPTMKWQNTSLPGESLGLRMTSEVGPLTGAARAKRAVSRPATKKWSMFTMASMIVL